MSRRLSVPDTPAAQQYMIKITTKKRESMKKVKNSKYMNSSGSVPLLNTFMNADLKVKNKSYGSIFYGDSRWNIIRKGLGKS